MWNKKSWVKKILKAVANFECPNAAFLQTQWKLTDWIIHMHKLKSYKFDHPTGDLKKKEKPNLQTKLKLKTHYREWKLENHCNTVSSVLWCIIAIKITQILILSTLNIYLLRLYWLNWHFLLVAAILQPILNKKLEKNFFCIHCDLKKWKITDLQNLYEKLSAAWIAT